MEYVLKAKDIVVRFCRITFWILFVMQGCENRTSLKDLNQFSSLNDTLVIRTEKVKGSGLFAFAAGPLIFGDTVEEFQYPVTVPDDILNVERIQIPTDLRAKGTYFMDIIVGSKGNEGVFVVDENNNKDLTDDSIRSFQKMEWYSSESSIKCKYLIHDGEKTTEYSSWVKIGTQGGNILYGRDEHLTASFKLDGKRYQVAIVDPMGAMTFSYGFNPELALISDNSMVKDTLFARDLLERGEYLNLDGSHYRFDSINSNGEFLTLIKEVDFSSKIGIQVGMIAPDFSCISVDGDTITSRNMRDRPLIIANSCGCGGDQISTEAFFEMKKTFGDKIYALRLDFAIESGLEGWHIDVGDEYNRDIYSKYRDAYCSRISYVVGRDGRIIDKFMVTDWKSILFILLMTNRPMNSRP